MDLLQQLECIESLHERLQGILQDDSLAELEPMTAELGSRVQTVLCELRSSPVDAPQLYDNLRAALHRHASLITLVEHKLQVTAVEMAKARGARQAVLQYAVQPALAEARTTLDTDLIG
jgi:hypothetical protein